MHIYFSGIGGTGIGPLALIAKEAGYSVSGSDKSDSVYIQHLKKSGINDIHIGQSQELIKELHDKTPIDWFVYSSAIAKENPDHPELRFCNEMGIKVSKRDELINRILLDSDLRLIAVSGTHGKTTTTAMLVWLFQKLGLPVSYSLGAKTDFADMGAYKPESKYFIYECDEYDNNFLKFHPEIAVITGIDWDHPDTYPTRESYEKAFRNFVNQSDYTICWNEDFAKLQIENTAKTVLYESEIPDNLSLPGLVNRRDAWQVINTVQHIVRAERTQLIEHMNAFPGVSRRFEKIAENLYSDYAHTIPKIRGALELAHEVAGENVVVVYEGLHNTRQHFIKDDLRHLFDSVKRLYIVPSYLAREDESLDLLTPEKIAAFMVEPEIRIPSVLDEKLAEEIRRQIATGNLVLCFSSGGSGSLDEWLRKIVL